MALQSAGGVAGRHSSVSSIVLSSTLLRLTHTVVVRLPWCEACPGVKWNEIYLCHMGLHLANRALAGPYLRQDRRSIPGNRAGQSAHQRSARSGRAMRAMVEDSRILQGVTEQPGLFTPDAGEVVRAPRPSLVQIPDPTPATTLGASALAYQDYLRRTDHSPYTITCFLSD